MLNKLNKKQAAMVKANASDIENNVPLHYKLDWRVLKFLERLGSGSFGDCYMGTTGGRTVAIKKMRAGLINTESFKAFGKEVVILARLDHPNIVTFVGYCLDPILLIVMEFIEGGTVADFVKTHSLDDPPAIELVINILSGSALGFEYLHAMEPAPILHRDIKSENILLTKDGEPRIADLGEARVMSENQAMTIVGTPGYTAPEVLRGEHYGTAADVFSFGILMSELVALRTPYADMLKDNEGQTLMSWQQITEL